MSGGAFPIRVAGAGVVAVITVSGLASDDDHQLVVDAITEYLGAGSHEHRGIRARSSAAAVAAPTGGSPAFPKRMESPEQRRSTPLARDPGLGPVLLGDQQIERFDHRFGMTGQQFVAQWRTDESVTFVC